MIEIWDNDEPGEGGAGTLVIIAAFALALIAAVGAAVYYLI